MKKLLLFFIFLTRLATAQEKGVSGPGATNKYIKITSLASYSVPDNFSALVWVKPPSTIAASEGIFCSNLTNVTTDLFNLNYINNLTSGSSPGGNYLQWRIYNHAGTNLVMTTLKRDIRDHCRNGLENSLYLASITCSYNGTNYTYKCYLNDSLISTIVASTKPTTFSNFTFFQDRSVAGRWGKTQVGDFKFYTYALTANQIDSAYFYNKKYSSLLCHLKMDTVYQSGSNYFTPDSSGNGNHGQLISFTSPITSPAFFFTGNESTKTLWVIDGNSKSIITAWPSKLPPTASRYIINEAIGGTDTRDMINRFDSKVKPYYTSRFGHNEIIITEGDNDMVHGVSLDSAKHDMIRYVDSVTTAGFNPSFMTIISRCNLSDSMRLLFNSWLKSTYGSSVLDMAADLNLGCSTCCSSLTYFMDGTHPTSLGYQIMADSVNNFYQSRGLRKSAGAKSFTPSSTYVYPNPSEGVTFIYSELPATVSITDVNGKVIYSYIKAEGDSQVLTDKYKSGMYFVNIVTDKDSITHKLIIK